MAPSQRTLFLRKRVSSGKSQITLVDEGVSEPMMFQSVPRCEMDNGLNGEHPPQNGQSAVRNYLSR